MPHMTTPPGGAPPGSVLDAVLDGAAACNKGKPSSEVLRDGGDPPCQQGGAHSGKPIA